MKKRYYEGFELSDFYKENPEDKIWWVSAIDATGLFLFSFDKETIFNFFRDYPDKLTKEQKKIFDIENPVLASLRN